MKYFALFGIGLFALLLVSCQASSGLVPASGATRIETGIDPESWVTIPAGAFLMGQHDHEIDVTHEYQIMVTDVTNQQYAQFINESVADGSTSMAGEHPTMYYPGDVFHGYKHEEEIREGWYKMIALDDPNVRISLDGNAYTSNAPYENHPVTFVTWFGAKAYCDFYGWRLPTEVEWEKAARGMGENRPFPWGETLAPENANYYSSHDIFEKTFGKAGSTTPVGFYNGNTYEGFRTNDSPSPFGLYDMAGNVWQWTGDVYEDQHYRYMRGGSKDTYGYNLRVWTRNSAGPDYYSPAVGFRCARDN
jgi:formylglycine-generating enzyme required for sulfatase activity